jgi:hypothetical protein
VVLNYGYETELPIGNGAGPWTQVGGDVTRVYEAIPAYNSYFACDGDIFGQVVDFWECDPDVEPDHLADVTVTVTDTLDIAHFDMTGLDGMFEVTDINVLDADMEPEPMLMTFEKTGFLTREMTPTLECGEDLETSASLVCLQTITFNVDDASTGAPLVDATVTISFTTPYDTPADDYGVAGVKSVSDETNALGIVTFQVPTGSDDAECAHAAVQEVEYSIEKEGYTIYSEATEAAYDDIELDDGDCDNEDILRNPQVRSKAYIQGYVFCGDGDDLYEPQEGDTPHNDTWVRLYNEDVTEYLQGYTTGPDGWYQFAVDSGFTYQVLVNTLETTFNLGVGIGADETWVANFELCVTPHAITHP